MKINFLCFFLFLLITANSIAQRVLVVKITNKENNPITSSYVKATSCLDSNKVIFFQTCRQGIAIFNTQLDYDCLNFTASGIGFISKKVKINTNELRVLDTLDFILDKNIFKELSPVVIRSKQLPVVVKDDTTTYKLNKFTDGTERKLQDILEKLPGITVNKKSGEIKFKGKSIEALMLDGDDLFGKSYVVGTKNINAAMIEGVQAIENYNDNYVLKNFENQENVALNIILKKTPFKINASFEIGSGIIDEKKLLKDYNLNLLGVNNNHKFFSTFSHNNIGENKSIRDFTGNNLSLNQSSNSIYLSKKFISDNYTNSTFLEGNRVNINNQFFCNYNGLFHISKKSVVKTNGFYTKDEYFNVNKNNSLYYTNGDTIINIDNSTNFKSPRSADVEIYLRNSVSKKILIESSINLYNEVIGARRNLSTNFIPNFSSFLNTNNFFLKYQSKLSMRFGKKALQIFALYTNNNLQQHYELSPSIFKRFQSLSDIQNTNYKKEVVQLKTILFAKVNNTLYNFTLSANNEINTFNSKLKNDINSVEVINSLNNVQYKKSEFKQNCNVNYKLDKLTISPSFNLIVLQQVLGSKHSTTVSSQTNFIFEPTLKFSYKINAKQAVQILSTIKQKPTVEEYIYPNIILQTNRLISNNQPSLNLLKEHFTSASYTYFDLYNQFEFSLNSSFTKNVGGYLSNYDITDSIIRETFFFKPIKNNNFTFDVSTKKYFPLIKSTFRVSCNYSVGEYNNFVGNTEIRNNISKTTEVTVFYKSIFSGAFNFMNEFIISNSIFINRGFTNTRLLLNSIQNNFEVNVKVNNLVRLSLNVDEYLPNLANRESDFLFLDIGAIFITKNKKSEFKIRAKNLLGLSFFSTFQNSDFSSSSNSINLFPRQLAINYAYSL